MKSLVVAGTVGCGVTLAVLDGAPTELRAGRKPRLPLRDGGVLLDRADDLPLAGMPLQLPPRSTRPEALLGPIGSSFGDFSYHLPSYQSWHHSATRCRACRAGRTH